jgi:hypothetical protein
MMIRIKINWLGHAVCAAVFVFFLLARGTRVEATYVPIIWDDSAPSHNWTEADNWNPSTEGGPANVGILEFLVTVPGAYDPVVFDVPSPVKITDFDIGDNSRLVLNPGTDLNVLRTANIAGIIDARGGNFTADGTGIALTGNRARVYTSNGSQVHIDAMEYSTTGLCTIYIPQSPYAPHDKYYDWTILSADGSGTSLALPALAKIDSGFDDGDHYWTKSHNYHHVIVTNGAELDLSGLEIIRGPVRSDDYLEFAVSGVGSLLDMSALATITNAGDGRVYVSIANGGHVRMGDVNNTSVTTSIDLNKASILSVASLQADSPLAITLNTAMDKLEAYGSLLLSDKITITAPVGGAVSVGGDFLYTHTSTASLNLGLAHVLCVGDHQQLEVGGTDYDLELQLLPDKNFGYEQLIVGETDHKCVVQLVDLCDNHQPDVADALYLFGIEDVDGEGGLEGLRILGGSTLVIGDLNVYALLDLDVNGVMEQTRIRDLFAPGKMVIPFNHNGNDGFIAIPEPATVALLGLGTLFFLRRYIRRF